MRWFSWLRRQASYAALVPDPQTSPGPLNPGLSWRSSADDCEAFLAGRLAEYRMDHRQFVSVSDWTNLLAHGSETDLMDEVAEANDRRPRQGKAESDAEWREARWYLAASVLHKVKDEGDLQRLQHEALVPLELELAAGASDWDPRTWVIAVDATLARHARSHGHPDHSEPGPTA